MNIFKVLIVIWGVTFAFSVDAAKENFERTKPDVSKKDAASGLPTGKRQHKSLQAGGDDDCNGLNAKACKKKMKKAKKKAKKKGKSTGYNSSRSNRTISSMLHDNDCNDKKDRCKNKSKIDKEKEKKRRLMHEK